MNVNVISRRKLILASIAVSSRLSTLMLSLYCIHNVRNALLDALDLRSSSIFNIRLQQESANTMEEFRLTLKK